MIKAGISAGIPNIMGQDRAKMPKRFEKILDANPNSARATSTEDDRQTGDAVPVPIQVTLKSEERDSTT